MSDTPQTDAVGIDHATATDREYRLRNLARELERENAALRERLQMIADAYALDANELRDIARTVTSKQTGDDAIMRQHLTEGGTPT